MASENLKIDENSRWVLGAVTNDGNEYIKNVRVNPITGALIVEANVTSSNTMIGSTIPGGTAGSVLFLDIGGTLAQDNNYFFYDSVDHYLGLGTNDPSATLDLVGTFQYVDGSQEADYSLITDANGNATWNNLATNTTFITNLVNNTTFTTNLANNTNFVTNLANNTTFITQLTSNTTFTTNLTGLVAVAVDGVTITGDGTAGNPLVAVTGGGGSVTSVSVVTANGVSGVVANPTTTPAITLTLGAITPSSVNAAGGIVAGSSIVSGANITATGTVLGSNLSGTNTGDQTITLTGDVTGSGTGSFAATIGANKVTYAKMQAVSTTSKLLGSSSTTTAVQEITLGTGLSMTGTTLNASSSGSAYFATTFTQLQNSSTTKVIPHGLGVAPSRVAIKAYGVPPSGSVNPSSNGSFDGTTNQCAFIGAGVPSNAATSGTFSIYLLTNTTGPAETKGAISVDSTNVTITWTLAGSPGSVPASYFVEAFV